MEPDDLQRAWRAESSKTRIAVNTERLFGQVLQAQRGFRATIFWRDLREAGISLVLVPVWLVMGITTSQPWTWYLMVPALFWVCGFIVVDRMRHRKKAGAPGATLVTSARESLAEVEHQIWLLRNVVWWYLAPFGVPLIIYFCHVSWMTTKIWGAAFGMASMASLFVVVLYAAIYYLNQWAVRRQLVPRRDELLALLSSLRDETVSDAGGDYPILTGAGNVTCSRRRRVLGSVCALVLFSIGVGGAYLAYRLDEGYPKKSPFAAVRWNETEPEVMVGGTWFKLISLDDIPAAEMITFSREAFGAKWRNRFEEDLVELLSRMGHPPGSRVKLVVQSLDTGETRILEDVPMTRRNRDAIRNAAQAREGVEGPREPDATAPSNLPEADAGSFAAELEQIRVDYKLPAMAAFALRGGVIVEQATVGTRSLKDETPVGPDAQWHLGSNTKAMTATVAGMLVEEGLIDWDSTIGDVLGKAAPDMDAGHRDTTLAMLLHHLGGIPSNIRWFSAPEDRVACAAQILSSAPRRRGDYAYSNVGYVVVGAMMEVATGMRWEDLMRERLFVPLGMKDTGFGAPSRPGAPWGHESGLFGWKPKDPAARNSDNPPVMGPAGTVHTTLQDYARFIAAQLAGARGKGDIVSAETFATLHTAAAGTDYGMGWIVTDRGWAGGRALTHGGSNTLWFVTLWLAPEKDMAFCAATNAGGDTAFKAVDTAVAALIRRHLESN